MPWHYSGHSPHSFLLQLHHLRRWDMPVRHCFMSFRWEFVHILSHPTLFSGSMQWLLYILMILCSTLKKFVRFFIFLLFFSARRRPHHLPSEEISLQPCYNLWWFQLSSRYWNHSHHHICKGRPQWRSPLSDGLLLHPSSYLSQMRGDSPFCHSERNIAGHTPWARRHSIIQKSHGRVEGFYWELEVLRITF